MGVGVRIPEPPDILHWNLTSEQCDLDQWCVGIGDKVLGIKIIVQVT